MPGVVAAVPIIVGADLVFTVPRTRSGSRQLGTEKSRDHTMNRERHTDEHTAALEAERAALIKELKQLLADPGNAGVPDVIFRRGWDGVRLYEPTESWYTVAVP